MNQFVFDGYEFDEQTLTANFKYGFKDGMNFSESIRFEANPIYDKDVLDRALFLAFILIGTSYYKTFPSVEVILNQPIDSWRADFFNRVYQEGLSQFAYENGFTRSNLAHFSPNGHQDERRLDYKGSGLLVMQSGGKDSLLVASLLNNSGKDFIAWYASTSDSYPSVLNKSEQRLVRSQRIIDRDALRFAFDKGAKNGHVPVTYILQSLAVVQAILLGKDIILSSIAHEGEERHAQVGDLDVTHQWSKTWSAETNLAEYVSRYISSDIKIGSPIRNLSELRVSELFVQNFWSKYGHEFSSCNVSNYKQGSDNTTLRWCGDCPKCANSYLLLAPFLTAEELKSIFNNEDLFGKSSLVMTFKGLLGIDNISKPFECIGEIEELRLAYKMSHLKGEYKNLSFDVPESTFDYMQTYPAQDWAVKVLQ